MPSPDRSSPDQPVSPFNEVFATEEIIREKYAGPIGNPYEAKPTPAMLALLGCTGPAQEQPEDEVDAGAAEQN